MDSENEKQEEKYYDYLETPIGMLTLEAGETVLLGISFGRIEVEGAEKNKNELLEKTKKQLNEYFAGKRKAFTIDMEPRGTEFQKKVWKKLEQIPYGETKSYGEIAKAVGNPKACRAVGMANHNNPIPILIPCHRVIAADHKPGGYGGGIDKKEILLKLEAEYGRK